MVGGRDCDKVTKTPSHGETFTVGGINVKALHTPCHTQDSICFFFEDGNDRAVFTGDTLFIGGTAFIFRYHHREMKKLMALQAADDSLRVRQRRWTRP